MKLRKSVVTSFFVALVFLLLPQLGMTADKIKVGVLHSLSGTMAISETTLKDTVLMMVEEQFQQHVYV